MRKRRAVVYASWRTSPTTFISIEKTISPCSGIICSDICLPSSYICIPSTIRKYIIAVIKIVNYKINQLLNSGSIIPSSYSCSTIIKIGIWCNRASINMDTEVCSKLQRSHAANLR